ncbi:MAG: hypothetical protein R3F55_06530 [Alphaproteobacteria bacterium]
MKHGRNRNETIEHRPLRSAGAAEPIGVGLIALAIVALIAASSISFEGTPRPAAAEEDQTPVHVVVPAAR